jgi:hypothetical protein
LQEFGDNAAVRLKGASDDAAASTLKQGYWNEGKPE